MRISTAKAHSVIGLSLILAGALLALPRSAAADDDRERATVQEARIRALEADVALKEKSATRLRALLQRGAVTKLQVSEAELSLAEANAKLAAARGDAKAVIAERVAAVEQYKLQLDRIEKLHKAGVVGEAEVEKARVALIGAKIRLAQAQARVVSRRPLDGKPQLKKLLIERRDVLRQLVRSATAAYRAGQTALGPVLRATAELTEAELELVTQPNSRIALLEKHVVTMRELEKIAGQKVKAGAVPQSEVLAATAARLQAQIRLAREIG